MLKKNVCFECESFVSSCKRIDWVSEGWERCEGKMICRRCRNFALGSFLNHKHVGSHHPLWYGVMAEMIDSTYSTFPHHLLRAALNAYYL